MQRDYIHSAWWLLSGFSMVTRIQSLLYTIFQEIVKKLKPSLNSTFFFSMISDFDRYIC